MLTSSFYANNRQSLIARLPDVDVVVVAGHAMLQRNGDSQYGYRQDSNLLYLTGVTEPEAVLLLEPKRGRETLLLPARTDTYVAFNGAADVSLLQSRSGVQNIAFGLEANALLRQCVRDAIVYAVQPTRPYVHDLYVNPFCRQIWNRIRRYAPKALYDIRPHLVALRSIKQADELGCIERAVHVTLDAIAAVERQIEHIGHEYEALAIVTNHFLRMGGLGHAFSPIVSAGINTCELHYQDHNQPKHPADLLLLDIGAEVDGYAADISRTLLPNKPSTLQQRVYDAVNTAQAKCIELLRPGVTMRDFAHMSDDIVGEQLVKLGLIVNTTDRTQVRRYFPHAIGHSLGLDVHDVMDYTLPLQEGMVITVEPGIYISEEQTGVRIEDDVLITAEGPIVLGRSEHVLYTKE